MLWHLPHGRDGDSQRWGVGTGRAAGPNVPQGPSIPLGRRERPAEDGETAPPRPRGKIPWPVSTSRFGEGGGRETQKVADDNIGTSRRPPSAGRGAGAVPIPSMFRKPASTLQRLRPRVGAAAAAALGSGGEARGRGAFLRSRT